MKTVFILRDALGNGERIFKRLERAVTVVFENHRGGMLETIHIFRDDDSKTNILYLDEDGTVRFQKGFIRTEPPKELSHVPLGPADERLVGELVALLTRPEVQGISLYWSPVMKPEIIWKEPVEE
ncbi:MAG: hypothetical protein HY378_00295 [Candidatus Brennerbacteria bacterium]|nr:hypothetical protein [Candidatus Brennerbacteria bacterium]